MIKRMNWSYSPEAKKIAASWLERARIGMVIGGQNY